ncbi:MAG: hypothetical protein JEZ12_01600 [Desulfobacterium sp.]|nr:hypothetical protein [Desulfobacterium sp.]
MITVKIRKALEAMFSGSKNKKIDKGLLFDTAREHALNQDSDMAVQKILLKILEQLDEEGEIKLPSKKGKGWDRNTGLPHYVTLIHGAKAAQKKANREEIQGIRNTTSWEPETMWPIVENRSGLKTVADYRKAAAVNEYLKNRPTDPSRVPARERALRIFKDEKALDKCAKKGLFAGRISLEDLDCFYCPEPLPYHPLSMDVGETMGKPLLVVENSTTYRSCWQANKSTKTFAGVIYGKGFKQTNPVQAVEGLLEIEDQLGAQGIWYFGDLDPAGLDIPKKINVSREQANLSLLKPAIPLYRELIRKGQAVPYQKSQQRYHNREWALQWLGAALAQPYLDQVACVRWPQEGLGEVALVPIFRDRFPLKKTL